MEFLDSSFFKILSAIAVIITVVSSLAFLSGKFREKIRVIYKRLTYSRYREKVIADINELDFVKSELIIRSFNKGATLFNEGDFLPIPVEIEEESIHLAKELERKGRDNELIAVVHSDPIWNSPKVVVRFKKMKYTTAKAFHSAGETKKIISANCLVFCQEAKCLVVHDRSKECTDFEGTLHTIGGGLQPVGYKEQRDHTFAYAAEREFLEETRTSVSIPPNTEFFLIDEFGINFIQGVFLGVSIPSWQLEKMEPTWEGNYVPIDFDSLEERLLTRRWTPSGWVHVMLWLALGCPGANEKLTFKRKSSKNLYKHVLKKARRGETAFHNKSSNMEVDSANS